MRYEIIIMFKGAHSSESFTMKTLPQVNAWLVACIDDTVHSVDVRDTVRKTIVTYNGVQISKASFIH